MSDVLLTHAYFLGEDEKEQKINRPYPTLGLLYVSAYLRRSGFGVEIFDTTFETFEDLCRRLEAGGSVLGIYTVLMTRKRVLDIIRYAKECGWTVVLGGPESANYPAEYLARGADVVVIGEGEETMAELLAALSARGPHRLEGVLGVVFKGESGKVVANPPRPQIKNLDDLPWPDRSMVDIQRYVRHWRAHHGMGSVNLITARGCPYRCRWCSHAVFGFTHRRRSVKDVADELEHILETYGPEQVWYADDVFTIHHRWLFQYAEELKRRRLKVAFETISRADRLMKDEVFATLAEMGCWRIWIGSESGSQRILDAMERDVTVEQVRWACNAARRHGIKVGMFLMWGYEGETLEDIEATIEHVKLAMPDEFLTTVAYPIKNTPYFDAVSDRVVLPRPWEDATDRDYKIRGRHSRAYYQAADRWLRAAVEAARLESIDPEQSRLRAEEADRHRATLISLEQEVEA